MKVKQPPRTLDLAELEKMNEPLTVSIAKFKGGQLSPIPLPIGESGIAGSGWSKGEVIAIDQGWLVNEWAGGGMYAISVIDSSQPEPRKLEWRPFWDPATYPEKIPPTLAQGARPGLITTVAPSQPIPTPQLSGPHQQVQPMSQFPSGLPSGGYLPAPMAAPAPQPYYAQQAMPSYQFYGQQQQSEQRRYEDRLMQMEQQLRQAQIEAVQRQHQVDLERERQASAAAIQRLEQQIAALTTAQNQAVSRGPSPEMQALQEQNRLMQQQMEMERREREAERRERELREMILTMKSGLEQQIAAQQQQFQSLLSSTNKSDPMIQMMMEHNRNSVDAMKEIARTSTGQLDKMQAFMMNPRDIMAMGKDATSGVELITQRIATAYGNVLDMQSKVMENLMQTQQGGSETIGLIREGVDGVKTLAERYLQTKGKEAVATQQAQAQVAQAQAQAAAVQAQAQATIAQMQVRQSLPGQTPSTPRPQPQAQPQARPQPQPGLSGARQGTNGHAQGSMSYEDWKRQREQGTQPIAQARETVNVVPTPPTVVQGPPPQARPVQTQAQAVSDEQWFGPLHPQVMQLRAAVALYHEGLKQNMIPEGSASPQDVAKIVLQAIAVVVENNIPIPAMMTLLNENDYNKFFATLLPNTNDNYREDIIVELKRLQSTEDDDEEDDDDSGDVDDDNDGENHDDTRDGSVVRMKPQVQARA